MAKLSQGLGVGVVVLVATLVCYLGTTFWMDLSADDLALFMDQINTETQGLFESPEI